MNQFNTLAESALSESLEIDKRRQRVLDAKKKIADLEIDEVFIDKKELLSYFESSDPKDQVLQYLNGLKLPKKFKYVWIQKIRVIPSLRGQGKGSEIFKTLVKSYPKGTLIALTPGEISSGKTASSLESLKSFYRQNGLTLLPSQGMLFGFKLL